MTTQTHPLLTACNTITPFTQTQMAAFDRYVLLQNQKTLGIVTPDDDFHEAVARCYFRAAGIPDELREDAKFMEWWGEGDEKATGGAEQQ